MVPADEPGDSTTALLPWRTPRRDDRAALCEPYPDDDLAAGEISTRVDDPGNDDPSVIEPRNRDQSGPADFGGG